jgi:hypothetical protein
MHNMLKWIKRKLCGKESQARYLIEGRMREQDANSPLSVLSNKILFILSKFDTRQVSFSGDTTLFEVGCYLFFLVDYWHVKSGHNNEREKVVNFLMDDFIRVFSNSIDPRYGNTILESRLCLYGEFANSESFVEDSMFYFEELVLRTENNRKPSPVTVKDFGPIHGGLMKTYPIRVCIQEFIKIFIPWVYEQLKEFYDQFS